jgi:hypothetical protein
MGAKSRNLCSSQNADFLAKLDHTHSGKTQFIRLNNVVQASDSLLRGCSANKKQSLELTFRDCECHCCPTLFCS